MEVSWAELAVDYEAFVGRALPASLDHRLRGTRLPLGGRAQVLRKAVGVTERHLVAGTLLGGAPLGRCRSLLPLGGPVCAGLSARHEVTLQLMRLATHCRDSWVRRLRAPACMRPPLGDRFLMDYFPRPLEGGGGATPVCQEAPTGALLGAWGAVVRQVQKPGLGHQPLLPGGPRGTHRPRGGPTLSESPAPGRAGTPGARP